MDLRGHFEAGERRGKGRKGREGRGRKERRGTERTGEPPPLPEITFWLKLRALRASRAVRFVM